VGTTNVPQFSWFGPVTIIGRRHHGSPCPEFTLNEVWIKRSGNPVIGFSLLEHRPASTLHRRGGSVRHGEAPDFRSLFGQSPIGSTRQPAHFAMRFQRAPLTSSAGGERKLAPSRPLWDLQGDRRHGPQQCPLSNSPDQLSVEDGSGSLDVLNETVPLARAHSRRVPGIEPPSSSSRRRCRDINRPLPVEQLRIDPDASASAALVGGEGHAQHFHCFHRSPQQGSFTGA
jgi:hypothetical protein